MMGEKEIRLLRAEEIDCRVGMTKEKGVSLLLYKDARADMKILDETFGSLGWKRSHQEIDGNLYCTVEIWDDEKKQWIQKQDVGTTSFTEQEKGQASDSFKRACVSVGIGRELYTAPFIWVPAKKCTIEKADGKLRCRDTFKVCDIAYNDDREIAGLSICNQDGVIVFEMKTHWEAMKTSPGPLKVHELGALNLELERTGVDMETVLERYHISSVAEMTPEIYNKAMNSLHKTASAA